ncbi:TetR/AcrR family transcriptional regulator [Nocardiopsis sp. RSe5-2]|uniref:TetR/AcrR family transcriptional regulator n=1 Tax=Nocardiopsis endophytica TaxID=3018445 RepID=A0ABT4TZZ3_9ACTN|nr:TetR/AcrR family transcriptional regulator [Nocardiopsis endophytica]MDA2809795.1 TetR/AcrR family transcriptional regulator [Nocardiopsis endophytica]
MEHGRRSPRQQRSRQTVAWILEAAAQLFREHGYLATTTNKVAERAGVSIGSLYQYFSDKDDLLAALAEEHMERTAREVEDALAACAREEAPLPRLVGALADAAARAHMHDPGIHPLLIDQALHRPDLVARLRAVEGRIAAALAAELRRAGCGGPDPETAALLAVQGINAQVHGALLWPPPGRTREDVLKALVRTWTAALGPDGVA